MKGTYDLWLVWCSFLVAVLASYVALAYDVWITLLSIVPAVLAAALVLSLLTERKSKKLEILQAREQLRLALVGSQLALFEWNIATGKSRCSRNSAIF